MTAPLLPEPPAGAEAQARAHLSTPQRQSPLAVVFLALQGVRRLGLSQLVIFAVAISQAPIPGGVLALVPVLVLVSLALGVVAWWRYTFTVIGGELIVHRGVFSEDRLTLPLDRVQSVSIEQGALHRLVDLVEVRVDSAGTSDTEFRINAVDRRVAEALRFIAAEHRSAPSPTVPGAAPQRLDGLPTPPPAEPPTGPLHTAGSASPPSPDRVLVQHGIADLAKVALSRSPSAGLALAFPLLALGDEIASRVPLPLGLDELFDRSFSEWTVPFIAATAAIAIIVAVAVVIIGEVVRSWELTVTATSSGFRRSAGLIGRTSVASSHSRIQRFETTRTPLKRLLGIADVRLPNVGSADLIVPGCRPDDIARLRGAVFEDAANAADLRRRISPASVFLSVRTATILSVVAVGALWFSPIGRWALLALAAIPWTWFTSRRRLARTRWDCTHRHIHLHDEVFNERDVDMPFHKLQVASIRQSPFERRRGLATLRLSGTSGGVTIPLIDEAEARQVADLALAVAETDQRPWM